MVQLLTPKTLFVDSNQLTSRKGVLQIATFGGFAPFVYREHGLVRGTDLQILNKFAESEHLTAVFQFRSFDQLWHLPRDEYFDVACAGISKFKNRDAIWSEPYAEVRRSALIINQNKPYIKDYSDIRRFAAVYGSAAHEHAIKHLPPKSTITEIKSIDEGINLLLDGTVEAVGTGSISARHQKKKWDMLESIDLHKSDDYAEEICFSVANNPLLLHKLNQFIIKMRDYQI